MVGDERWAGGPPEGRDAARSHRLVAGDRLGQELRLGAEEAEERHFIHPGLFGNPARRSSAKPHLGIHATRRRQQLLSIIHAKW